MADSTEPMREARLPIRRFRVIVEAGPNQGEEVTSTDSVSVGAADGNDLVLDDRAVSQFHLRVRRTGSALMVLDRGSTNGTRVGTVELRGVEAKVDAGTILTIGRSKLRVENGAVETVERGPARFGDLHGEGEAMRVLFTTLSRAAATEMPVVITGESGTGKELAARAIHDHGARCEEPFVTVDCGAVSPTLFQSQLFGHERGAFTGATARAEGAFERAGAGTVFLDEIGELPMDLQASLLGVLERRTYQRLGGAERLPMQARVIAATHRDLQRAVNSGAFRLDLFYRLAVVRVEIPPLHERIEDLPMLADHFLSQAGSSSTLRDLVEEEAFERMLRHDWPGNVRELRNVVLGALAMGSAPALMSSGSTDESLDVDAWDKPFREAKRDAIERFERQYLSTLMHRADGNIRQAARDGKMDRSYLMELLRRYGMR
ncbi:MAG: sigma 54-interacting transcriptional regulator [Myxococcota bacterium]